MPPRISVLMANFNNAVFLETAIESVVAQSLKDWELILIDDGSSDNSVAIIQKWLTREPRIRFHQNETNRGVTYTKRRATDLAQAPLIVILDPDDALEPQALSLIADAHSASPEASLIWADHFVCNAQLEKTKTSTTSFQGDELAGYLGEEPGAIHHLWSFKKEFYHRTTGFNPRYPLAEDQDLFYKLEEVGATRYLPEPLYCYRFHDRGISTGAKTAEAFGWHLLAMLDALKRRRETERGKQQKWSKCVQTHWQRFPSWGVTKISAPLLNSLLAGGIRAFFPPQIIWSYVREKIRRKVRGVS